ncbi:hypothetical protein OHV00_24550, partial [Vibrio splendidus]|nr:hypothetical protein [Vibrio splendidus]
LPAATPPDYPGYVKAILDGGVKIVETAGNNPQKWLPALQEAGVKVIHKCTFGVNLTFLPAVTPPDYPGYVKAILDGGVKIVETAGNNPQKWLPALQEAG